MNCDEVLNRWEINRMKNNLEMRWKHRVCMKRKCEMKCNAWISLSVRHFANVTHKINEIQEEIFALKWKFDFCYKLPFHASSFIVWLFLLHHHQDYFLWLRIFASWIEWNAIWECRRGIRANFEAWRECSRLNVLKIKWSY